MLIYQRYNTELLASLISLKLIHLKPPNGDFRASSLVKSMSALQRDRRSDYGGGSASTSEKSDVIAKSIFCLDRVKVDTHPAGSFSPGETLAIPSQMVLPLITTLHVHSTLKGHAMTRITSR